jgi:hypothetical protein
MSSVQNSAEYISQGELHVYDNIWHYENGFTLADGRRVICNEDRRLVKP